MSLESVNGIGYGGVQGQRLNKILQELQNEQMTVINGAAAASALAITGVEEDSTIRSVIMFAAGVPSDVTSDASPLDRRASGTITCSGIVAGDAVAINGKTYTAVADTGYAQNIGPRQFKVGASNNATAANLAQAVNAYDPTNLLASAVSTNVVTLRARARGTGGNSITLDVTASNAHATRSGATLSGGTATQGIVLATTNSTGNKLMVRWTAKPAAAV